MRFNLRGGASFEFKLILAQLSALPPSLVSEGPDAIVWSAEKNKHFSVGSFRRLLYVECFAGSPSFPASTIWSKWAPTKVQFFCWLAF
ncbi:hypothetical protein LINPERHAP2_LOCUS9692 [Linum perenne]